MYSPWKNRLFLLILLASLLLLWMNSGGRRLSWSTVVYDSRGGVLRVYLSKDEKWRIPLHLEDVDPLFIKTLIKQEDRFFLWHPGVNPFSVLRASLQNLIHARVVSGASTITMQVVRLIHPEKRNLLNKIKEAILALQMEKYLSKRRILEIYLSLTPYGGNIEGVGAASLAYFGKLPAKLLPHEIAFLLTLPRAPSLSREKRKRMRDHILRKMWKWGFIDRKTFLYSVALPLPTRRPFPKKAPHACDFLREKYPGIFIHSTIDPALQGKVDRIVNLHRERLRALGANEAAVVVIENSSGKVKAIVGSMDYWDPADGQIKGFFIFRSPGSALKPFLYIMALEKGTITTESLLPDAPMSFSGFSPKDFDLSWRGLVRAEDALSFSLNVPFVYLLRRVGYWDFIRRLKEVGIKGPLPSYQYGLSAIVGGMEVRLLALANLYASLSRGGLYFKFRIVEGKEGKKKRLFNPGAVYLTLRALSKRGRPDAPALKYFSPSTVVYWKTGTSWGRRDAWSLGFSAKYTVGVWVGNFNSKGAQGIVGAEAAAPLMFDIFKAIGQKHWDGRYPWFRQAQRELVPEEVCGFSGYPPQDFCPSVKKVMVLKNHHPYLKCPYHRKFLVETGTGFRACPFKKYRDGELSFRIFKVYPPSVAEVLREGFPPPFPPGCPINSSQGVRIISPQEGATYFQVRGIRGAGEIIFQAVGGKGRIYWFCDGNYLGSSLPGEVTKFSLREGLHSILAQGQDGSSAQVKIRVMEFEGAREK